MLLVASGFYWLQVRAEERLVGARRADTALENAYEELLSGTRLVESGPIAVPEPGISIDALVARSPDRALADVTLIARYQVRGEPRERRLQARLHVP